MKRSMSWKTHVERERRDDCLDGEFQAFQKLSEATHRVQQSLGRALGLGPPMRFGAA
jgi:hypothetical protein